MLTDRQQAQLGKVICQGRYLLRIAGQVNQGDQAGQAKVRREWELLKAQTEALLRTRDAKRGTAG